MRNKFKGPDNGLVDFICQHAVPWLVLFKDTVCKWRQEKTMTIFGVVLFGAKDNVGPTACQECPSNAPSKVQTL